MAGDSAIAVEVVYALPDRQDVVSLEVPPGTTVIEAIRRSGIGARHPEVGPVPQALGIHGRSVTPETVLRAGDRVEIYRPLVADPKQARRRRAARKNP